MAIGRKTGGKIKGVSRNKPKPIILAPTDENRALVAMGTAEVRTPKQVMLSAMLKFERLSDDLMAQAKEAAPEVMIDLIVQAHKFTIAAVQCAEKVAPYIHARLIAVESRSEDAPMPFVIRAPAVMLDSSAWQAAVGAAVIDMEAQSSPVVPQTEVAATQAAPVQQNALATAPVVLAADPKTNKITIMPPGPRVVQPSGSQEWLASVKKVG